MKYFRTPFIQLENYEMDHKTVNIIPEKTARKHQIIALEQTANILTIGMINPENEKVINTLEKKFKLKITPVKVDIQEWANAVNNNYNKKESGKCLKE